MFFQIESIAVEILEVSSVNTLLTRVFVQFALGIICLPVEITDIQHARKNKNNNANLLVVPDILSKMGFAFDYKIQADIRYRNSLKGVKYDDLSCVSNLLNNDYNNLM